MSFLYASTAHEDNVCFNYTPRHHPHPALFVFMIIIYFIVGYFAGVASILGGICFAAKGDPISPEDEPQHTSRLTLPASGAK